MMSTNRLRESGNEGSNGEGANHKDLNRDNADKQEDLNNVRVYLDFIRRFILEHIFKNHF